MKSLCALISLFLFASCNTTQQTEKAEPSGFLGNYDKLEKGSKEKEQAQLRYVKKDVAWHKYQKIIIDPIQVWATEESELRELDKDDLKNILSFIHAEMRENLGTSFKITDQVGTDTVRIRTALTDGEASIPIMDTLSTVVPIGLAVTYIKYAAVGTHSAVGMASVEIEIVDSVTNERLFAGIDQRSGTKAFEGKFDEWDDLQDAFKFWTDKMRKGLVAFGSGHRSEQDYKDEAEEKDMTVEEVKAQEKALKEKENK